jgi:hypothetical protein
MNSRQALPVALTLVVAAGALAPAVAGPKPKPITESYSVQGAPVPLPLTEGNSCTDPDLEGVSITTKTIKTVGAGTLQVDVTKFSGDWDITVLDDKGNVLGVGSGTATPTALTETGVAEELVLKTKKAMILNIAVCNFLGSLTAEAKYTFTYK